MNIDRLKQSPLDECGQECLPGALSRLCYSPATHVVNVLFHLFFSGHTTVESFLMRMFVASQLLQCRRRRTERTDHPSEQNIPSLIITLKK